MTDPAWRRRLVLALAAALAACGPGTGGTGLPPGAATVDAPAAAAPAPVTTPPARAPELEGRVERLGLGALRIGATVLAAEETDAIDAQGRPLAFEALVEGLPVRAWRTGARWLVQAAP